MEMVKGAFDNWRAFTQSSKEGATTSVPTLDDAAVRTSNIFFELHNPHVIASVPLDSAAFHVRTPHYCATQSTWGALTAQMSSRWARPTRSRRCRVNALRGATRSSTSCVKTRSSGTVAICCSPATAARATSRWRTCVDPLRSLLRSQVYGANYPRLRRAKAKYDPHCVFARYFPIEPLFS